MLAGQMSCVRLTSEMEIRAERQQNPVADEVSALVAVVRPILLGLLWGLKGDVAAEVRGYENVKLRMLNRLRRPGDGDCGICFEYAVHDAMRRRDGMVLDRVDSALKLCSVPGNALDSILFAVEKTGSEQFIDTAIDLITPSWRFTPHSRPSHSPNYWSPKNSKRMWRCGVESQPRCRSSSSPRHAKSSSSAK